MNVVSVMAHQHDEMRCLSTMLRCLHRGDALHFLCLTDGSSGVLRDPYPSRKVAAAIRRDEMTRLAVLGAGFDKLCRRPDAYWGERPAASTPRRLCRWPRVARSSRSRYCPDNLTVTKGNDAEYS